MPASRLLLLGALFALFALGVAAAGADTCAFDPAAHRGGSSASDPCVPASKMNAFLHKALAEVYAHVDSAEQHDRWRTRDGLTPRAKQAAATLDFQQALPLFRAAYFFQPYNEHVVLNLAEVLYDYALAIVGDTSVGELPIHRQKQVWRLLCEALAGAELATYIQNKPLASHSAPIDSTSKSYAASIELAAAVAAALDRFFPGRCHSTGDCEAYSRGKEAMRLELETPSSENHLKAISTLCIDKSSVLVSLSGAGRRRGVPSTTFGRSVFIAMRVCGVVHIPRLFQKEVIDPIKKAQRGVLDNFLLKEQEGVNRNSEQQISVEVGAGIDAYIGGIERATVSPGRYEIKMPTKAPFTSPGFGDNHFLLHVMKIVMLGERLLIDTFSFITSVAGAPDQDWHVDVTGLFTERGNVFGHLPPQGVVAVVPFDKMDTVTGPTEHLFGSHVALDWGPNIWPRMASQPLKERGVTSARVPADVGDIVLFDSRLVHRGTANKARRSRSIASCRCNAVT